MIWALVVTAVGSYFNLQAIPSKVHTLLGSSLGLLLVFRTNASYGRYWEGRALWEKLHNKTRDLARMISIYEDCLGTEKVTSIARLICAYPLALREHLTGEMHKSDLIRLLGPALSDTMDCSVNKPLWLCNRLALLFRGVPENKIFSSRERLALLGLVNDLSSIIGSCERLVQTPVPLSYARHTSRFLTLYLWSLPMVLVADFSPVPLVFVTGLCTWALFGILEIGLLIEDPFQRILRTSWTGVIAESVMYVGRAGGRGVGVKFLSRRILSHAYTHFSSLTRPAFPPPLKTQARRAMEHCRKPRKQQRGLKSRAALFCWDCRDDSSGISSSSSWVLGDVDLRRRKRGREGGRKRE